MSERKFNSRGKLSAVILTIVLSLDFVARFLEDVWLLPLASHVRDREIVLMAVNGWASLVWQALDKFLGVFGKPLPHDINSLSLGWQVWIHRRLWKGYLVWGVRDG